MIVVPRRFTVDDPRIEPITETGCWIWMGYVDRDGYGATSRGKHSFVRAHRAFYERAHGPIPTGLVLDHACRTRCCVNPDHLRAVSVRGNVLAVGSEAISARNAAKMACGRCGAAYEHQRNSQGGRICRVCKRRKQRDHYHRQNPGARRYRIRAP